MSRFALAAARSLAISLVWAVAAYSQQFAITNPGGGATLAERYPRGTAFSKANSLSLRLSAQLSQLYCYQPIDVLVSAPAGAAANRSITVRLELFDNPVGGLPRRRTAVEQDLDLPAGATEGSLRIMAPRLHDWQYATVSTWVDGARDEQLGGQFLIRGGFDNSQYFAELALSQTFFRPTPVEATGEQSADPLPAQPTVLPFNRTLTYGAAVGRMPDDWRALSKYDAVVATPDELSALAATDLATLSRWVEAGGLLVVEEVGRGFAALSQVEQLLQLKRLPLNAPLAAELREETTPPPTAGGQPAKPETPPEPIAPPNAQAPAWSWAEVRFNQVDEASDARRSGDRRRRRRNSAGGLIAGRGWFAERPCGFGLLVAFPVRFDVMPTYLNAPVSLAGEPIDVGGNPPELEAFFADALQRYLGNHRSVVRLGGAPDVGTDLFSNWLVPGVGAAPVDAFRWLITLFVIFIGPVSYFALRAVGRTNLLLFTAPLAALAFTGVLFAYATLGDGFGIRARVRGIAILDQQAGRAVSWSRQTYYAGLAPAQGLTFPQTAMVYPIVSNWSLDGGRGKDDQTLEVLMEPGQMRLKEGWLASRDTRQLLVQNVGSCDAKLTIRPAEAGVRVVNELGADIEMLIALDAEDNWWLARQVAQGAQAPMERGARNDIVNEVRALLTASTPEFPPGLDPIELRRTWRRRAQGAAADSMNQLLFAAGLNEATLVTSRLEVLYTRVMGVETGLPAPIDRGAYLAVTRRAVATPLAFDDLTEEGSVHVTLGRWAP